MSKRLVLFATSALVGVTFGTGCFALGRSEPAEAVYPVSRAADAAILVPGVALSTRLAAQKVEAQANQPLQIAAKEPRKNKAEEDRAEDVREARHSRFDDPKDNERKESRSARSHRGGRGRSRN